MLDKGFSWPMIVAYFVVLNMWILLLLSLEVDKVWVILNPLHFVLIFNIVFGITYQIKAKKTNNTSSSPL